MEIKSRNTTSSNVLSAAVCMCSVVSPNTQEQLHALNFTCSAIFL